MPRTSSPPEIFAAARELFEKIENVPVPEVVVPVDTTAAGDSFAIMPRNGIAMH